MLLPLPIVASKRSDNECLICPILSYWDDRLKVITRSKWWITDQIGAIVLKYMKKNSDKKLDTIYRFMAETYEGNWSYRWGGVPWMKHRAKAGKNESILAHEWACMGFWLVLKDVCPALRALVDTTEIYERVWGHDMGETFIGDISQFRQLRGAGKDKHVLEQEEIRRMTAALSPQTARKLQKYSLYFEKPIEKVTKLEVLVAKLIDTIQGNHFAFVYARGLTKDPDRVAKIVERT